MYSVELNVWLLTCRFSSSSKAREESKTMFNQRTLNNNEAESEHLIHLLVIYPSLTILELKSIVQMSSA